MRFKKKSSVLLRNMLMLSCLPILLASCHSTSSEESASRTHTVIAQKKPVVVQLYYSGVIEPIRVIPITAPAEGTIMKKYFRYGDYIKRSQTLFLIKSDKLQDLYRDALTQYLTAKKNYFDTRISFQGTKALYKAQIVDRQSYLSEKSTMETNRLTYLNSKNKLLETVREIPNFSGTLEQLSLDRFSNAKRMLEKRFDKLKISASVNGIALFPTKNTNDDTEAENKKIQIGTAVKKGQTLVSIGDLSGLAIMLEANEIDINAIKKGLPVEVTSAALPNMKLKGIVSSVGAQAKPGSGGQQGLAKFSVMITVPHLTAAQQHRIRVGISAKVRLEIKSPKQITLPLDAITEREGHDTVSVLTSQGHSKTVPVTVGRVVGNEVVIQHGIQPGEKIIVRN